MSSLAQDRWHMDYSHMAPRDYRRIVAEGQVTGVTAGACGPYVQGNLAILPRSYAFDFLSFCQANPRPCPLLGVSELGEPGIPALGDKIDIRSDVPSYYIYRDGEFVSETTDIGEIWREDFVSFVLGCSFSFEAALLEEGIPLRHIETGKGVAMYRTNIETTRVGPFHGPMVVSMRPMKPADAIRSIQITSRYPSVHGAPVHLGDPADIGIADIGKTDWGDPTEIKPGEIPVFWACGVTPQSVVKQAKPEICITHKPGCMLVTDLLNRSLATI